MNTNIKLNKLSINLAASLLAVVLIVLILYATQTVFIPMVFAVIISVMIFPLCNFLESKLRLPRALATVLGLIIAITILAGLGYLIVIQVIDIAKDSAMIVQKLEKLYNQSLGWVTETFSLSQSELLDSLMNELKQAISTISKYLMTFFSSFGGMIASFVLVPIYAFFFSYYRDFFRKFFFKAFKSAPREKIEKTLTHMYDALQNYMIGQLTVMGIVAVLNTIGLYFMGLDHAWFFGLLCSLLMILPYVGIAIGSIFPAIFALATFDSPYYALGVVAWFQVVQFLEGNFITPNIVGGKVSLNPMVSMLAIIFGGMLFGFAGFMLALPMTALLKVIFDSIPQTEAFGYLLGDPETEDKKEESNSEENSDLIESTEEVEEEIETTEEEEIKE